MVGPDGVAVEQITAVRDGVARTVLKLTQHGYFHGEYRTPEELAAHVDLARLVEELPAVDGG